MHQAQHTPPSSCLRAAHRHQYGQSQRWRPPGGSRSGAHRLQLAPAGAGDHLVAVLVLEPAVLPAGLRSGPAAAAAAAAVAPALLAPLNRVFSSSYIQNSSCVRGLMGQGGGSTVLQMQTRCLLQLVAHPNSLSCCGPGATGSVHLPPDAVPLYQGICSPGSAADSQH